jgi:hypothetical protein
MDDYERTERTTTTVSYSLPNGTPWAEMCKLFAMTRNELMKTKKPGAELYDDEIRVHGDGERVYLVFKKDLEEAKRA